MFFEAGPSGVEAEGAIGSCPADRGAEVGGWACETPWEMGLGPSLVLVLVLV